MNKIAFRLLLAMVLGVLAVWSIAYAMSAVDILILGISKILEFLQ
jgi:hypothetical protein